MTGLVGLGVLLIVAWVFGFIIFKIAGILIHLLLIVGAVMLLMGLIRRAGAPRS